MEHKESKNNQSEQQEEKKNLKNVDSISSLCDNFKGPRFVSQGCQKEKRKSKKLEIYLKKIMKENFPNLVKEIDMQFWETQRVPNKMDAKRPTLRHIIIKMPKFKDKERILKAAREKKLASYRGVSLRLSADFSKETLQARRNWQEIFQVMKSRDLQPRLLYPAKLSFRIKGQIKSFPDKKKLKEFVTTNPVL